jgi:hypothetical protein
MVKVAQNIFYSKSAKIFFILADLKDELYIMINIFQYNTDLHQM